jgi:hypothetical protein
MAEFVRSAEATFYVVKGMMFSVLIDLAIGVGNGAGKKIRNYHYLRI